MTQGLRIWKDVQQGQALDIVFDGVPNAATFQTLARPGMHIATRACCSIEG